MELRLITILALLCVTLVGSDASESAKDYWQSVWPNTAVPKPLLDLLLPGNSKGHLPIQPEEMNKYWTVFFEHDLHPHKIMNLGLQEHFDKQTFIYHTSGKERDELQTSQPFGWRIWRVNKERDDIDKACGRAAAIGEDKYCAKSLESMMDFAISKLGKNIKVLSSSFVQNQDQYVVEEVNKIGEKGVMCHRLNFKNVVFYCHQINATTIYMVPLEASDGTKAKALTICHHDTRGMDPDMLYNILKIKPGTVPVCHFVGDHTVAWVPNPITSESSHLCVT